MKISELAERTGARVEGLTDDIEISGAAGMDEAGEGHVTFLANPRYTPRVNTTRASAIYLSEEAQTDRQMAILRVKDPYLAYTRALRIFNPEAELEPFVHPSAVISKSASLGEGVTVMAGVLINANSQIGNNVIINTGAIVEHDCIVGDHIHVATGARLAGTVTVGTGSHIGAGAIVLEGRSIGSNSIVGAGAVVVRDVPDEVVVMGVPARIYKRTSEVEP